MSRKPSVAVDKVRAFALQGMTRQETARATGLSYASIVRIALGHGVNFTRANSAGSLPEDSRVAPMVALYSSGYTLQQIGEQYGITRERVRQIMTKHRGITWRDGGMHKLAEDKARRREAARDAKSLKKNGCTWDEYCALRDYGRLRRAAGLPPCKDPLRAFAFQKHAAANRGVGWELTLWQWWSIWKNSGHWEHRGRGQGYVMCRFGDLGPYAVDNVFIDLALMNSSERVGNTSGLPVGVRKNKKFRGYSAQRMVSGKVHRLGTFPTPELAHAAYLSFGSSSEVIGK